MILITTRVSDLAEWIDANCAEPSSYTIAEKRADRSSTVTIELNLSPVDRTLFDIRWAGEFIEHPDGGRWFDNTPLNQTILAMRANGP